MRVKKGGSMLLKNHNREKNNKLFAAIFANILISRHKDLLILFDELWLEYTQLYQILISFVTGKSYFLSSSTKQKGIEIYPSTFFVSYIIYINIEKLLYCIFKAFARCKLWHFSGFNCYCFASPRVTSFSCFPL